ncbi:MAG TPA: hypothetical protein PLW88_05230, partial [Syntrophorhabdaceae bacterium]|nr:hypothetical protein [Syntrophorhabdaceae bacterium]
VCLKLLFLKARFASAFDRIVIDGIVDGTAQSVRMAGFLVRKLQTGRVQAYIGFAVFILVIVIWIALRMG